jgi:hypothetical protein
MFLPEVKVMFGASRPPTLEELRKLPRINGDANPGVYLVIIHTPGQANDTYIYIGSATSSWGGLTERTSTEHGNSQFRKMNPDFPLYKKVDEPGKGRYITCHKLCSLPYPGKIDADVQRVKILCLMAETICMSWLHTWQNPQSALTRVFVPGSPWTSGTALKPLNKTAPMAPFRQNYVRPVSLSPRSVVANDSPSTVDKVAPVEYWKQAIDVDDGMDTRWDGESESEYPKCWKDSAVDCGDVGKYEDLDGLPCADDFEEADDFEDADDFGDADFEEVDDYGDANDS